MELLHNLIVHDRAFSKLHWSGLLCMRKLNNFCLRGDKNTDENYFQSKPVRKAYNDPYVCCMLELWYVYTVLVCRLFSGSIYSGCIQILFRDVIHTVTSVDRNVASEQQEFFCRWLHWTESMAWKCHWCERYETGGTEHGRHVAASVSWHLIYCIIFFFSHLWSRNKCIKHYFIWDTKGELEGRS